MVHLKRWTSFFETFPVGPNRSIEFWTEISRKKWFERKKLFVFLIFNLEIPMHLTSANQNKALVQLLICFVSRSSNACAKVNEKGPVLNWLSLTRARGDCNPDN